MSQTRPWASTATEDPEVTIRSGVEEDQQIAVPVREGITCAAQILRAGVIGYNVIYIVLFVLATLALIFTPEGHKIRESYAAAYGLNWIETDGIVFLVGFLYCLLFVSSTYYGAFKFRKCFLVPSMVLVFLVSLSVLFQAAWFSLFLIALPSLLFQMGLYRLIATKGVNYTIA